MALNLLGLLDGVDGILGKVIGDKKAREAAKAELQRLVEGNAARLAEGQLEVNKVEAAHKSLFVAGWRPFIGWVCGLALLYHFILCPLILFVVAWIGVEIPDLPEFEMGELTTILGGMLGLGAMRTAEKVRKVAREK